MGERNVPAPHLEEGEVSGSEVNVSNGRTYLYSGHFLGEGTIVYRVQVFDADGESRGTISGEFSCLAGADPRMPLEKLLRLALRQGRGYRP